MSGAAQLFGAMSLSVAATSTGAASASAPLPAQGNSLRIVSKGGGDFAYLALSTGAAVAVVADATARMNAIPFLVGSDICLNIPNTALNFSIISETGQTVNVVLQVGEGE